MSRRELAIRGAIKTILPLVGLALVIAIFPYSIHEVRENANVIRSNAFQRGDKGPVHRVGAAADALNQQARQQASLAIAISTERVSAPKEPASNPEEPASSLRDLSYLADYAYSEVPPDRNPAEVVLQSLADIPVGTPIEEIKHASDAFGLDFTFMKAVAKIESDFDPKERTGSYIGLFQLSHYEFARFGSGDIIDPRDNAVAAAYKFATESALFKIDTHIKPTLFDLYLIHQQGWQGAAQHLSHPDRIAWQSMCATDEGHDKGEKWCKRAIWGNTLPSIKKLYKSVDNLTSGAFADMWRQRLAMFYSRYSEAISAK
jgi:hypothetical protein